MSIYSAVTGKTFSEIEKDFDGKGYGDFKLAVGESVADCLAPIQEKYRLIREDKAELERIYREGAEKASYLANKTMRKVYKKIGLIER